MQEPLKNWKTILGFIAIGLLSLSLKLGWIDVNMYTWIVSILGPLTGIALRQGMKRHPVLPGPGK